MAPAHFFLNASPSCLLPWVFRVIAVDWSGARAGARKAIWLAEVDEAGVRRLECGRDRSELSAELIATANRDPELVVGLDFAFSTPAWYLRERSFGSVRELWRAMDREGEELLREPLPPFWKTSFAASGLTREQEFRRTDKEIVSTGSSRAQSVFKLVGAGHVGTGSIRGMAELHRLVRNGFRVWPFDEPSLPLIIEIYPRALTGPVVKSDARQRRAYLDALDAVAPEHADLAASDENAFDALASALQMWVHREALSSLRQEPDYGLEGRIWAPTDVVRPG